MPEERVSAAPAHEARALLERLEWTVIRRLDGLLQGNYRTLWRGAGLDLADLREYQHHDDVRHIDWNVTARLQQPYVREFTIDEILVDRETVGRRGRPKRSELLVARSGTLLTEHGDLPMVTAGVQ